MKQKDATIINVTSAIGNTGRCRVWVPIYSATKAAMHSFTLTLHHQLENTNIEVVGVLPQL
jgi:uncharacterized oxidoreductase